MFRSALLAVAFASIGLSAHGEDPAKLSDQQIASALGGSDDFGRHRQIFIDALRDVMSRRSCTLSTIRDEGGWWRSTNKGKGVYFIYCGGLTAADRFYLDVRTGKLWQ